MAVNESEIPQFQNGHLVPIGRVGGQQIIHGKQVSILVKMMKSVMKSPKSKSAPRKSNVKGRRKSRGIESDQKLHVGNDSSKMSQFY